MRLSLVGIGYWGRNYIKAIDNIENIELSFICSPHQKFNEELPKNCKFTNNYNDILEDKETEGVIICTPPKTHYDLTKAALIAGKNVLIEKPMTCSSEEAFDLYRLSKQKSRILMVGHLFLYHPAITQLKELIDKGEFGDLFYLRSIRSGPGPVREDINAMWNLAPHDISISNYLFKEIPKKIIASELSSIKSDSQKSFNLVLEYLSGYKSFIEVSWSKPTKKRYLRLMGSERIAIFDDISEDKLIILDHYNTNLSYPANLDIRSPLELQCRRFCECIENKEKPISDGYEGYTNVRILECAQKSLESKAEVDIDFTPQI